VDAAISQRDFDLAQVFGISQGSIQGGFGYTGAQLGVDKLFGPGGGQGALSGALSGAATGTSINAGWGTLIGAVVGAAAGYFSGR